MCEMFEMEMNGVKSSLATLLYECCGLVWSWQRSGVATASSGVSLATDVLPLHPRQESMDMQVPRGRAIALW